jgi:hypothetical protein
MGHGLVKSRQARRRGQLIGQGLVMTREARRRLGGQGLAVMMDELGHGRGNPDASWDADESTSESVMSSSQGKVNVHQFLTE